MVNLMINVQKPPVIRIRIMCPERVRPRIGRQRHRKLVVLKDAQDRILHPFGLILGIQESILPVIDQIVHAAHIRRHDRNAQKHRLADRIRGIFNGRGA